MDLDPLKFPGPRGKPCRKCGADRWMLTNRANDPRYVTQTALRCAPCANKHKYTWIAAHPDQRRNFSWRDKGIDMTVERYILLEKAQGNACAVCRKPTKKMVVDHDHRTGITRGLLCRRCNVLAQEVEILQTMLQYIENGGRGWGNATRERRA